MLSIISIRSNLIFIYLFFILSSLTDISAQSLRDLEDFQLNGYQPSFDYEDIKESGIHSIAGPDDLNGYLNRAISYLRNNEAELAKADLNYILKYNESYGAVYFYRGLCFKALYKVDSAISDFNKALSLQNFEYYMPSHLEMGHIQIQYYRKYDKAKEHFDIAYKMDPDNVQVNYAYGFLYFKIRDFQKATKFLKEAIQLAPQFSQAYYLLADIRLRKGEISGARSTIDLLLKQYPFDEKAVVYKALLLQYQRQYKKGIALLKDFLIKKPDNTQAKIFLGLLYLEIGEIVEGFKLLSLLAEENSLNGEEYGISELNDRRIKLLHTIKFIAEEIDSYNKEMQELAIVLLKNIDRKVTIYTPFKEYDRFEKVNDFIPSGIYMLHSIIAEKSSDQRYWESDNLKILNRDSSIYHVYRSLGNYYMQIRVDEANKAEKYYTKMLFLDRDMEDGYKLRGMNRVKHREYIKAIQDFNIYLNFNKISPKILEQRALCYQNLGYLDKAAEDYATVINITPNIVMEDSYLSLASIKMHLKDTIGAIEVFDLAIAKLNDDAISGGNVLPIYKAYNIRGSLKLKSKQFEHAIEDFSRAIDEDQFFGLAYFNRGVAHYENGNFKEAEEDFSKWLELNGNEPEGIFWRGKTRFKLKHFLDAKVDFEMAMKLGINEANKWLSKLNDQSSIKE